MLISQRASLESKQHWLVKILVISVSLSSKTHSAQVVFINLKTVQPFSLNTKENVKPRHIENRLDPT